MQATSRGQSAGQRSKCFMSMLTAKCKTINMICRRPLEVKVQVKVHYQYVIQQNAKCKNNQHNMQVTSRGQRSKCITCLREYVVLEQGAQVSRPFSLFLLCHFLLLYGLLQALMVCSVHGQRKRDMVLVCQCQLSKPLISICT